MEPRAFRAEDRTALEKIIRSVSNFNRLDVAVALELVDDVCTKAEKSDYIIYVLEDDSKTVRAYVCFGKTPLTESTFDFYWMAIDPTFQGKGIGFQLFQFVERQVKQRGGRRLMCETSSLDDYHRVIRMYEKLGYRFVARIADFYKDGDDKLIYVKEF